MKKNGNNEYNEKYICWFFTIWNLKSAITYKCGRVVLFLTSVFFAISKLVLLFSYSFHVPCIILSNVYFYIVQSMFPFLFNSSQSKASVDNQRVIFFFWSSKIFFCSFANGHIHNIVSTLNNIVKIDFENNIVSTLFNVVNIIVEIIDSVGLTFFQRCKFQRWQTPRCFSVDLTLPDLTTSHHPNINVEITLKGFLGVDECY